MSYQSVKRNWQARLAQLQSDLDTAHNLIHYLSASVETGVETIEALNIELEGLRHENADLKAAARELVAQHTPPVRVQRTASQIMETVLRAGDNRVKVGDQLFMATITEKGSGLWVKSGDVPEFQLDAEGVGHLPQHRIGQLAKA